MSQLQFRGYEDEVTFHDCEVEEKKISRILTSRNSRKNL